MQALLYAKNSNIIYRCVRGAEDGPREYRRGKYSRNKHAREAIKEHVFGYGPSISHYRRAHAPNRLYLPSDLTEKSLHKNYEATQDVKVSYSLYCKVVRQCNISFVRLGHEQCETCVAAELHKKVAEHSEAKDCTCCSEHELHIKRASESRMAYRADGDSTSPNEVVFSVDLQKVSDWNYIMVCDIICKICICFLGHSTSSTGWIQECYLFIKAFGL